ncbi:MAG TPA: phosphoribosylanthranilate isomerase [Candidatus Saccharimonadia bacterium]|nr:phosphoribosylanthranilate isomerase [Candidatus Saccharimonadia bacterium]
MSRTRVKFCGITRVDDAQHAGELGADAIGLVFAPRSLRALAIADAARIAEVTPAFVARVGLFLDADPDFVRSVIAAVALDALQFHGSEPREYCASFGMRYIKAVAMGDGVEFETRARAYPDAAALLLDSHASGGQGGTGARFDWARVPRAYAQPIVLAGGLTADNVADAIAIARPYAVDVSSGIEARPGIKDSGKMQRFLDEVRRAG